MRNLFRALALSAAAALCVAPALIRGGAAPLMSAQDQAKTDLYNKWLNNRKGDVAAQKTAYEAGKEYLQKYGADNDEYVVAVKKWVDKYEAATIGFERQKKFADAVKQAETTKVYAPVFAAGREIITAEPENLAVLLTLSTAGSLNVAKGKDSDKSLYADSIAHTRQLMSLIEAGKATPADLKYVNEAPNRETALAWLTYRLGLFTRESSPDEAVGHLLKAAQGTTAVKNEPSLYFYLAQAYESEYQKLAADYKARFEGKEATDESRMAAAKLEQVLDRIIDAYARAVALTTKTDAASAGFKTAVTAQLTELYKQRRGSEAGIQEFVSGSASRRLPLPTDPVPTPTPAPAAAATPTPTP
jgi:hypothetical protein